MMGQCYTLLLIYCLGVDLFCIPCTMTDVDLDADKG